MIVGIYESYNSGVLKTFGTGELISNKIPEFDLFKKHQISFNCVKIGEIYVWSFMGTIISIQQYCELEKKALWVHKLEPDVLIYPSEPCLFYGFMTKDNKKVIKNFNEIVFKEDSNKNYIIKVTEPFLANNLTEAKHKLISLL